jgi:hypothetical protein
LPAFKGGIHLDVTRSNVVQDDNVGSGFLMAERRFPDDGRFDRLQARLDVLDQGHEVRYDGATIVIPVVGFHRTATICILHKRSPRARF